MAKDNENKQVLIHAGIAMLKREEVLQYVSSKQYEAIKEKDPEPMFVMMSTGHEGEANGALYADMSTGQKLKRYFKQLWPLRAVKELVTHFLNNGKTPVFEAHEIGAAHRYVVGNIIHSTKKVINQITHAVGIAHISNFNTKRAIEQGDFDACSIEAECYFRETEMPMHYEVAEVANVTGVALCNTRTAPPAFKQANIMAVVTAMADEQGKKQGVSNMAEGDKVISFRDIQEYIREHRVQPDALFKVEDLTAVPAVKSAFETDFEAKTKDLTEAKAALEKEIVPFKKAAKQAEVHKHIRESELLKDAEKATVEYLTKILNPDISDTEKPQGVVDAAIKSQLSIMKAAGVKIEGGKSGTDEENKDEENNESGSDDSKNKEKSPSPDKYTDPKENDLIPKG